MSFFDRLLGREEAPDKTQGNWYDPEPMPTRYNHSPNRLINGGLRDLLGALADGHAQSQGMDPMYAPKRKQERFGEAMEGYTEDPMGAINRVSKIDAGMGQKYLDNHLDEVARRRQFESQDEARKAAAEDRQERQALQAQARFAGMLRSVDGPEAYDRIRPILSTFAERFPNAGLEVPSVYNSDWVETTRNGAILPKDQTMMDYRQENLSEKKRSNLVNEDRKERTLQSGVVLQGGRLVQTGIANDFKPTAEEGRNTRAENAEEGRDRRSNKRGLVKNNPSANPFAGAPPPPSAGRTLIGNGKIVGVAKVVNGKLQWTKP